MANSEFPDTGMQFAQSPDGSFNRYLAVCGPHAPNAWPTMAQILRDAQKILRVDNPEHLCVRAKGDQLQFRVRASI